MKKTLAALILATALLMPTLAAASSAGAYFGYLEEVYNRFEKPLQGYLITELEQFLAIYPDCDKAGAALYLLGRSHDDKKQRHQALAVYAKLAFLHPGDEKRGPALESLRQILARERAYSDRHEILEKMIDEAPLGGSRADRRYAYLEFLSKLDAGKLHERVLAEHIHFRRDFSLDPRLAHLDLWEAVSWANKGKSRESALAFRKFELLHPDSPSAPYARFTRAELLTEELGKHQEAATILSALVSELPGNKYAAQALFLLAGIQERRFKEHAGAIRDYRRVVAEYRESSLAPDALLEVAVIQEKRQKNFPDAVATLLEFADLFPRDTRGAAALEQAGDLQAKRLKNYEAAAASYARVAEAYPAASMAVEMLLAAGKLHEEKTGKLDAAEALYRQALENYPGSKKQGELEKRLGRIQVKRGG
jgi:TolA-binding protein